MIINQTFLSKSSNYVTNNTKTLIATVINHNFVVFWY